MLNGPTTFEDKIEHTGTSFPSFTICPMLNTENTSITFDSIMKDINGSKTGLFENVSLYIDHGDFEQ